MKDMYSSYTTRDHGAVRPLILTQSTTAPGKETPILFQETCLGLALDQSQLVLRRYFERYSPSGAHWVEYINTIPTTELIHWIITHGQLRIECSENTPSIRARA
ncbi:hypothetical protein N8H71_02700 [Pseudomonas koreensis]|uniref:hypothetical protein n=1 Tax=Pseudomonas koreensis TaxID=198620 RepID=UPI0021C8465E|nr:hypothetical protein [Pseudomonas koreensis]MCU0070480.1 hypothetical protein [Pseudomonas koreensis]